jgi:hypothetical protein
MLLQRSRKAPFGASGDWSSPLLCANGPIHLQLGNPRRCVSDNLTIQDIPLIISRRYCWNKYFRWHDTSRTIILQPDSAPATSDLQNTTLRPRHTRPLHLLVPRPITPTKPHGLPDSHRLAKSSSQKMPTSAATTPVSGRR